MLVVARDQLPQRRTRSARGLEDVQPVFQVQPLAPVRAGLKPAPALVRLRPAPTLVRFRAACRLICQKVGLVGEGDPAVEIIPGPHVLRLEIGLFVETPVKGNVLVGVLDKALVPLQMHPVQVFPWHGLPVLIPVTAPSGPGRYGLP